MRLFSFGGHGLALAALALVVFGAYDSYPAETSDDEWKKNWDFFGMLFRVNGLVLGNALKIIRIFFSLNFVKRYRGKGLFFVRGKIEAVFFDIAKFSAFLSLINVCFS